MSVLGPHGWNYTLSLDRVPETAGYYELRGTHTLLDGVGPDVRGGGVTLNMRKALQELAQSTGPMLRPCYAWKPDQKGAEEWLNRGTNS